MPRIIQESSAARHGQHADLVRALARELRENRPAGQPLVDEERFERTGSVRVYVYWDKWHGIPEDARVDVILRAYEEVEGPEFADRIVLASGFTIPEAREGGLLPFAIQTAIRDDDPVSIDQCRKAMIDEGASVLADPSRPELRFPTETAAEECLQRLIERLPGSEQIWLISKEMNSSDRLVLQDHATAAKS